jgi:hypothetical protein
MKLGELAIARALGILACAGLIWVGIGFAGVALTEALSPSLTFAGAAAVTAFLLLLVPACVVLLYGRRPTGPVNTKSSDSILSAISHIARERPLLAMLGAALFGAAEVLLNSRKKKK